MCLAWNGTGAGLPSMEGRLTITNCADVLAMDRLTADQAHRVDMEAVVTYAEPVAQLLFVSDGSSGMYVYTASQPEGLKWGDRIRLRGVTGAGKYAPFTLAESIDTLGKGALPEPSPVAMGSMHVGGAECQWVEVEGVVQYDDYEWLHRVLDVYDGRNGIRVRLANYENLKEPSLLDARIRVRGVVGAQFDRQDQVTGFNLYCPDPGQIEILDPPTKDPFALPVTPLDQVFGWPGERQPDHLVHVRGVVNFQMPGQFVAIGNERSSLIAISIATNRVQFGEEISLVGFVSRKGGAWRLNNALWKSTGQRKPPTPAQPMGRADLAAVSEGQYLKLRARLLEAAVVEGRRQLVLQFGGQPLIALLANDAGPADWSVGGVYDVTGTYLSERSEMRLGVSLQLLFCADARSLELVAAAPRMGGGWILPSMGLVVAGGLMLALLAWKRFRRQTGIAHELEASLAFSRAQFVRSEQERERLARDMHDGVIQSLYAVGMGLEDFGSGTELQSADAQGKLARLKASLNHLIRDVRGFITGMEPASIQGRELKTALKSVILTMGDDASERIVLSFDSEAVEKLTSRQATELFHICKEAISNSLRHADAGRVQISFSENSRDFLMEIADNGRGFAIPDEFPPGHGLNNIEARAKHLAARFDIDSHPSSGTILRFKLPKS